MWTRQCSCAHCIAAGRRGTARSRCDADGGAPPRGAEDPEAGVRESLVPLVARLGLPPPAARDAGGLQTQDASGYPTQSAPDALLAGCMARLEHPCRTVQSAATELLAAAWPKGCPTAVNAAQFRLSHQSPLVRRAALECFLALTVPSGGFDRGEGSSATWLPIITETAEATAALLADCDERVRNAAVRAFGTMVKRCGGEASAREVALSAIRPSTSHQDAAVRSTGAEALVASCETGDEAATGLLVALTSDADEDVRWSALQALSKVAKRGHEAAVSAARICAADNDEPIRIAAIQALAAVAEKGDAEVLSLLRGRMQDTPDVVHVTMTALVALYPEKTAMKAMSTNNLV
mmetsp:Transcript_18985/g.59689  ORF Transcript_18985/g.59689 Transcript_18985/m.59689 type:complete len:351 (+) Transcript_18985:337-1389(+)